MLLLFYVLDPASRNLVNEFGIPDEDAIRNQLPGQGRCLSSDMMILLHLSLFSLLTFLSNKQTPSDSGSFQISFLTLSFVARNQISFKWKSFG